MLDKDRFTIALGTIKQDESGYLFYSGGFIDLMGFLHNAYLINVASGAKNDGRLFNRINSAYNGITILETLVFRLDWQKELIARGELDRSKACLFAACDIDLFYVQYRSLFDQLAKIISLLSRRPEIIPSKSFFDLLKWVRTNSAKIDDQLVQLVVSCDWFLDMRKVRDSIVHRDGQALVFLEKNRILFQVLEGIQNRVNIPEIMFNENVVDFELYAGMLMGYLLWYLEKISAVAYNRLEGTRSTGSTKGYHPGLRVLRTWIERVSSEVSPARTDLPPSS